MIAGIDEFKEITNYDIETFFNDYNTFVNTYYNRIIDYYNGADSDAKAFAALDNLAKEISKIEPLFTIYRERFNTIDFWTIMDLYSDILVKVNTCLQMSKWMRSSRLSQFDSNVQVDRILSQGETFERISKDYGSTDYDNDWALIAIDNLINEEDYTPQGGLAFKVTLKNASNFNIANIIDNLSEENVYGKDIYKVFSFENNDLVTVVSKDALKQTLDTILSTVKGSIPEFPEDGIPDDVNGTNVNAIQYPGIFRNLLNLFRKDGRWTEINLLDLYRDQDSIFMKLEVQAVLKDSFITNVNL